MLPNRFHTTLSVGTAIACVAIPTKGTAQIEDQRPLIVINDSETSHAGNNTSAPWVGQRSLFIWAAGGFNEFEMAEFGIESTLPIVDLIPRSGVANAGTITSPILTYPQCSSHLLLAELIVDDPTGAGGSICLGDSDINQRNCSRACPLVWWANLYVGFSSDGTAPCEGLAQSPGCYVVSVDGTTWGSVKARYR